jgi:hypothetical protein
MSEKQNSNVEFLSCHNSPPLFEVLLLYPLPFVIWKVNYFLRKLLNYQIKLVLMGQFHPGYLSLILLFSLYYSLKVLRETGGVDFLLRWQISRQFLLVHHQRFETMQNFFHDIAEELTNLLHVSQKCKQRSRQRFKCRRVNSAVKQQMTCR